MMKLTIQEKMRRDWDRRAAVDPFYWVSATQEADRESYERSGEHDCDAFLEGLKPHLTRPEEGEAYSGLLVDLGCGIGRMSAGLVAHFEEVVGVDVSEEMIRHARSLYGSREGLRFEVNSGTDLSLFSDESVSVICSYSVLPHLPPDVVEAYFLECGRILRPGGIFRYQFWVGESHHPAENDSLNIHVYDDEALQRLHAQSGLTLLSREEIDYLDPVLKIRPCWLTVRRDHAPLQQAALSREVSETLSEEERRLEYELCLYLALRHSERGERQEAEEILERAIQFDKQRSEAYLHWADLRLGRDDLRGAALILEQLTEHRAELPLAWLQRGLLAEAMGQYQPAKGFIERSLRCLKEGSDPTLSDEEKVGLEREAKTLLRRIDRARLKGGRQRRRGR